jgi:2-hydroxychromene-2-carboxylate isomerase
MTVLYYDLGSPYSYLAVERATGILGAAPRLQPVLAGAIFDHRGRGSWGRTGERAANQAEIERRAARDGLPPITWPPGWPPNTLSAMRAAAWGGEAFARAAFRAAFAHGADLGDVAVLEAIAQDVGLAGLRDAIADPDVKAALRTATDAAIALGVPGVPTLALPDGRLVFGDDRLSDLAPR